MKVKLMEYTKENEKLVSLAAKLCYSKSSIEDMEKKLDDESIESYLNMLMELKHESPIEHISYTFYIEGVSRTLTHQLVRHRIASYSQQSQRYVNLSNMEYIIPPSIEEDEELKKIYVDTMNNIVDSYEMLWKKLKLKYINEGMKENSAEKKAIEDARYVFPNACETKIMVTMNARSLLHFFNVRCCERAQWEIRDLAIKMLLEVKKVSPIIFKNAGPSCVSGNCSEGKMYCGKINYVREKFSEYNSREDS